MKKQNNSEVNNKIDVNQDKQPKKKMKGSTIVIIVLVVLLLFSCVGNMGGSTSSTTTTTTEDTVSKKAEGKEEDIEETEPEPEETEEAEAESITEDKNETVGAFEQEKPERDPAHFYIGDTITYNSGSSLKLVSAGVTPEIITGIPAVYLDTEINNLSGKDETWRNSEFSLYIDDYQVDTMAVAIDTYDSVVTSITIDAGRKAKFRFTSMLPSDYANASKIEVRVPGSDKTVLVKDNGVYVNGLLQAISTEPTIEEQIEIDVPDYEYADDDPYNPDNLYGIHTKVGDPSVTLEVYDRYTGGYYVFAVKYGTGDNDFITFNPDAGVLLEYYTEEMYGFYDITTDGIIISDCDMEILNGTYK